ncbi:MAG: PIN domain-containing protein [Tatlockia sp.]|nr:PIN domain-containing protein [Tatlockia sp.]
MRTWFSIQILPCFSERIIDVDLAVVRRCAKLHTPKPKSERDALMAATALVHGMTVVTRNVNDFEQTEVELLNPWKLTA